MAVIFTEMSGYDFNVRYKNVKFYKFLNDNLIHNKFQYFLGLNIDHVQFRPVDECLRGGLYFCEESKCHIFWRSYGKKVSLVEIPDDARVYVERNKFKANKLIIKDIVSYDMMPDEFWLNMIKDDGLALKYIRNQTEDLCKYVVAHTGYALKYVS